MERNWELRLLCQSDSTLRNFLENIKILKDIDELPKGVTVDDLFERVSDTSVADMEVKSCGLAQGL